MEIELNKKNPVAERLAWFVEIDGEGIYAVQLVGVYPGDLKIKIWQDGMEVWVKFSTTADYKDCLSTGKDKGVLFHVVEGKEWFPGKIFYKLVEG